MPIINVGIREIFFPLYKEGTRDVTVCDIKMANFGSCYFLLDSACQLMVTGGCQDCTHQVQIQAGRKKEKIKEGDSRMPCFFKISEKSRPMWHFIMKNFVYYRQKAGFLVVDDMVIGYQWRTCHPRLKESGQCWLLVMLKTVMWTLLQISQAFKNARKCCLSMNDMIRASIKQSYFHFKMHQS